MKLRLWVLPTLLAVFLVSAVASGCGQPAPVDGWIEGEVYIGPVSPVEQPGVPNEKAYSATLLINRASDQKLVATARSDAKGSFVIALQPGIYVLEPVNGDPLPTAPSQEFTILSGLHTRVRVDYDSGIR
jgi:hypothetical protein